MMFSKTTLFMAFAAIASVARAQSPPGCLLGAVNTYEDPADLASVCKASDAKSKIASFCGDDTSDALDSFADICNNAGVKISTDLTTSASSGSAKPTTTSALSTGGSQLDTAYSTGSPSASASGSLYPSASGSANGTWNNTQTGYPAESTGAAGRLAISAAALFAGLGAMAAAI